MIGTLSMFDDIFWKQLLCGRKQKQNNSPHLWHHTLGFHPTHLKSTFLFKKKKAIVEKKIR